jgi:hypothetical protein
LDSERDFWQTANRTDRNARSAHLFDDYVLDRFTISDWFPRAPGVFWTEKAEMSRSYVWGLEQEHDAQLGGFYKPQEKMSLIENGGLGTIRLRPRKIDGEYYWFATAVTGKSKRPAEVPPRRRSQRYRPRTSSCSTPHLFRGGIRRSSSAQSASIACPESRRSTEVGEAVHP